MNDNAETTERIKALEQQLNVRGEIRQLYEMYSQKFIYDDSDQRWKHFYDAIEGAYYCGIVAGREIERKLRKKR